MLNKHTLFAKEIGIANDLRHMLPRGRSLLFHGTRQPCTILRENKLNYIPIDSNNSISFSRMLHVAVHYARLSNPKQDGFRKDETYGAVLVLDRDRLCQDYAVKPYQWHLRVTRFAGVYEGEEAVFRRDITDLHRYLVGVLWLPKQLNRPRPKFKITAKLQKQVGLRPPGPRKKLTKRQIRAKLREIDVLVSQGHQLDSALLILQISDDEYLDWTGTRRLTPLPPARGRKLCNALLAVVGNMDKAGLEVREHEAFEDYFSVLASVVHDRAMLEVEMVAALTDLPRLFRGSPPQHIFMLDARHGKRLFARITWCPGEPLSVSVAAGQWESLVASAVRRLKQQRSQLASAA